MERQNNRKNWSTATAGTATTTAFLLTIPLLTYIILFYGATSILYPTASNNGNNTSEEHEANISSVDDNNATGIVVGPMKKNVTNITETTIGGRRSMDDVERPSCPISYKNKLLSDMLNDLYVNATMCRPQDVTDPRKHRLPKVASKTNKTAEPRGTMVVYIAVGLLLTSLGAAIVELYKAKGQAMATRKTKPTLTRKCSLADLTVLKHNRKELMRRDTMWDIPEGRNATEQLGRKILAFYNPICTHKCYMYVKADTRQSEMLRRCSFPVTSRKFSCCSIDSTRIDSRRTSTDNDDHPSNERRHSHIRLMRRH